MENKRIVLTGANSGIGFETLKLISKDNKVLAVDLNTDNIESLKNENITSYVCDVSNSKNVDSIFDMADKILGGIDIFYANAGFPYFEKMDYQNWDRIENIFSVNTFSPIYTLQKYIKYLDGKDGQFGITISAMGKMGMPGFALYASTKFAMQGFVQSIRLELPKNVKLTCLYPVATNTGFFAKATEGTNKTMKKPFPVQSPSHVANSMVKGLDKKKKSVNPCKLFSLSLLLFAICPPMRSMYWAIENKKFKDYLNKWFYNSEIYYYLGKASNKINLI